MNRLDEAKRQELINQSKNVDIAKSYGTTRYVRRTAVRQVDTVKALNRIDMNALFKAELLSFKLPVQGETDDYLVEVLFEGVCRDIENQVKANNGKFEYKCIYRAIINAVNNRDVLVACTCPDFKYRFSFWSSKGRYNAGQPQIVPARITNPNNSKGIGCKHILNVLDDVAWALKLASCINNYIEYMREHFPEKYEALIYPKIYGEVFDPDAPLDVEDDEFANSMDNEEDAAEIDAANSEGVDDVEVQL